jgi:hypothetical protein
MQFEISIRSSDPNIGTEITRAKIAEGITIRQRLILREIVNPPIDFIVYVGENVALPVAASLIAKFLYDKLKERRDNKLTINNQPIVNVNVQNIEQLIINVVKENKNK